MNHVVKISKLTFGIHALLAVCMLSTAFAAEPNISSDWAQFQGPNRNGTSPENNLARAWPDSGPRELWSTPLGEGFAGPAVRDGEIYLLDRIKGLEDVLRCYSLETGKELWSYAYDAPGNVGFNGSRTTPAVTDEYVFSVGVMGDLYCIDRKTHKPVWNVNLMEKFGLDKMPKWGIAQAPSVYKDLVIVAPHSPSTSVVAFHKSTGKVAWKSPAISPLSYATPVIQNFHGVDQVVMLCAAPWDKEDGFVGDGVVAGLSLEDGSILWEYKGWKNRIPIPFPTLLSDNQLFITGGYEAGSVMIQVKKTSKGFEAMELFTVEGVGSQIHQPLVYNDHLYLNNNENSRKDGMTCVSLNGVVKWRTNDTEDLPTFSLGNLVLVDDMILNMDGDTGILHLIDPTEKGYTELAQAHILTNRKKKYWSPMAVSQGKLIVRSQETLKCIDLRTP